MGQLTLGTWQALYTLRRLFGTPRANVPNVLMRAKVMHASFVANADTYFASPPVTMPAFLDLIEGVQDAQIVVATRAAGRPPCAT